MTKLSRKVAYLGVFTALSLICFLIENLLPPLFIPGARLGLGNIFIILALVLYSLPEAFILLAAKCILAAIFGGPIAILYSAAAGVVSLILTFLLIRFLSERVSVVAIAALSAVVHNMTQLTVYALITKAKEVFLYAPYLAISGLAAGIVTGLVAFLILKYFPFDKVSKDKSTIQTEEI